MQRLSVVIVNYNYGRYIAAAIDSALALDWADVEVVVVDDGSTDGSREVIRSYGDRVRVLLTENAGQRVGANHGYAMSTGEVIVFLDSDDVLPRDLAARLAAVWSPRVSKVQFSMQRIDADGLAFGVPFPAYRPAPTPAEIRRWAAATTAYPTPPGSGNAYARSFLDQIFPVGPSVGEASDSACLAAAPFFGDVVTVPEVVVGYRRHGENDSNLLGDDGRFPREVARAWARWRFAQAASTGILDDRPLFRSRELLELRVASRRVAPAARPLPGDRRSRMFLDSVRAPFQVGPESAVRRVLVSAWCLLMLLTPERMARRLLTTRFGGRS